MNNGERVGGAAWQVHLRSNHVRKRKVKVPLSSSQKLAANRIYTGHSHLSSLAPDHNNPPVFSPPIMQSSDNSQPFISLYNRSPSQTQPPNRSRLVQGTSASIWAPQPQPSETTWPRALDSFTRVAERENASTLPLTSREDVFGPLVASKIASSTQEMSVGAIGDGRKKNSPEFDDTVRVIRVFFAS